MIAKAILDHFDEIVGIAKPKQVKPVPKNINKNTPENLDKFIDKFFKKCPGLISLDESGITIKITDGRIVFIKRSDMIEKLQNYNKLERMKVYTPMVIWEGFGIRIFTYIEDFLKDWNAPKFWVYSTYFLEQNIIQKTMPFTVIEDSK
jgi:hypothetical protein